MELYRIVCCCWNFSLSFLKPCGLRHPYANNSGTPPKLGGQPRISGARLKIWRGSQDLGAAPLLLAYYPLFLSGIPLIPNGVGLFMSAIE